ncbi:hypothetical protein LMG7141_03938 [Ralstonia condita]|uniref:DUF4845 domain-containing protein n=1 Tax=Ralstonia condita TaxID=3058600 RepID=A0ABM9JQQ2_9RALS|nr:DUF4845 domain-containing protein [Ralstonia sp. LMG 7141]MDE2204597.1 DUF4845 domain-containing protein [Burkholderiaceae bacterium]CAJ0801250.1 hypothetical protein LMG7141_03938 [Ralstonia sp. LMG 7141]
MRNRQTGLKRPSHGITMFGILIGIIVLITAVLPAIRAIPSLMEYQAITRAVKQARDRGTSRQDVVGAFDKQAAIDDITSLKGDDLEVLDAGGSIQAVHFSYKREIPLYGPISMVITYSGTLH